MKIYAMIGHIFNYLRRVLKS